MNNRVNAKALFEVSNEVLSIIDEINLELQEIEDKSERVNFWCQELRKMNGVRVVNLTDFSSDGTLVGDNWKQCQVYGEYEVSELLLKLRAEVLKISGTMDSVYIKVKDSCEMSSEIDQEVQNVENVLSGSLIGREIKPNNYNENGSLVTQEQVIDSIEVSLDKNRALTEQVSQEIYRGVYEKFQQWISESGGEL